MSASPFSKGIRGVCPRCGQGRLFDGLLKFARGCEACGLSYETEDAGDGPAVFVILIIGIFVLPIMMLFHYALKLPMIVTFLIWVPIIIVLTLYLLRLLRGVMFNLQYKHKAREVVASDVMNKDG